MISCVDYCFAGIIHDQLPVQKPRWKLKLTTTIGWASDKVSFDLLADFKVATTTSRELPSVLFEISPNEIFDILNEKEAAIFFTSWPIQKGG